VHHRLTKTSLWIRSFPELDSARAIEGGIQAKLCSRRCLEQMLYRYTSTIVTTVPYMWQARGIRKTEVVDSLGAQMRIDLSRYILRIPGSGYQPQATSNSPEKGGGGTVLCILYRYLPDISLIPVFRVPLPCY